MTYNFVQKCLFIEAIKCHEMLVLVVRLTFYLYSIILPLRRTSELFFKIIRTLKFMQNMQFFLTFTTGQVKVTCSAEPMVKYLPYSNYRLTSSFNWLHQISVYSGGAQEEGRTNIVKGYVLTIVLLFSSNANRIIPEVMLQFPKLT